MHVNFLRGTSEVDWCESNYSVATNIAEFFNTISNALFFIIPPMMIYLFNDYAKYVTNGINMIWLMLMVVGAGSVYFHSTLSFAGQMIDELSILWILMTSVAILYPDRYLISYFQKKRNVFHVFVFTLTVLMTYMACLKPELNAYFLMLFVLPIVLFEYRLIKSCESAEVIQLSKRATTVLFVAVTFWLCDRLFCDIWLQLNIPYFHSVFHVLIYLASSSAIVIFSYFTALAKCPQLKPTLNYWPNLTSFNQNANQTNQNNQLASSRRTNEFLKMFLVPYVRFSKLAPVNGLSTDSSSVTKSYAAAAAAAASNYSSYMDSASSNGAAESMKNSILNDNKISHQIIYKFA